jgi:hypothetical protein
MMLFPLLIKPPKFCKKVSSYNKFLFLICIFFTGCSEVNDSRLEKTEEKKMAGAFLEELLFQEGGCFTLLGDKPITSMLIFKGAAEDSSLENLSPEALETLSFVDYKTAENFGSWKKLSENLNFQNFFFVEAPVPEDPSCYLLYFVNILETAKIFQDNFELFHRRTGIDNWEKMLSELKKPNRALWQNLFKDHYLAGLLYGYGKDNVEHFCRSICRQSFSESFEGVATKENFPIPVYATSASDKITNKYEKLRENIKKKYQGRDTVEFTLTVLQSR